MTLIRVIAAMVIAGVTAFVVVSYRRDISAARAHATSNSQIVHTELGPVEYGSGGDGSPVFVIHGAGGGWDQGVMSAERLIPHGFRIVAPSRFGYLRTPMPVDSSVEAEADTWSALIDSLSLGPLPVIGFSAGAAPALQLTLRHPKQVSALVLIVPGAAGLSSEPMKGPTPTAVNALYGNDFVMWAVMQLVPSLTHRLVGVPPSVVATLSAEDRESLERMERLLLPVTPRRLGVLNEGRRQNAARLYPIEQIGVPTLFVSSPDDLYRTLPYARYGAGKIPGARLIEFERGGHLLLGNGDRLASEVAQFLRAVEPADD